MADTKKLDPVISATMRLHHAAEVFAALGEDASAELLQRVDGVVAAFESAKTLFDWSSAVDLDGELENWIDAVEIDDGSVVAGLSLSLPNPHTEGISFPSLDVLPGEPDPDKGKPRTSAESPVWRRFVDAWGRILEEGDSPEGSAEMDAAQAVLAAAVPLSIFEEPIAEARAAAHERLGLDDPARKAELRRLDDSEGQA